MTAQRIQEVALKYFAQKGYDGTTLGEIADDVGIKKPSIYAHFASKSALFLAVVEEVANDYKQYWNSMLTNTENMEIEQRLYHIFNSVITYFAEDRVKMKFWARVWMFPPEECDDKMLASLREMNDRFIDKITVIFSDAVESGTLVSGNPEYMARLYFCMLDGTLMRTICYSDTDIRKNMPHIWQYFWLGIQGKH